MLSPGYQSRVEFGADQYADSLPQQTMVINRQDSNFPDITRHETLDFLWKNPNARASGDFA